MQRPRLIAFCVFSMLMLFVAGSGFVFSQGGDDTFKEFMQGYGEEFSSSITAEHRMEYAQFANLHHTETLKNMRDRLDQRTNVLGENPSREESEKYLVDVIFDIQTAGHKTLNDKEKEWFPNAQVMQQRKFQLYESLMRRLESQDNAADIAFTSGMFSAPNNIFNIRPDFLELSPEQLELITSIQKETALKIRLLKASNERIELMREMGQLVQKISVAQTPEERLEIDQRIEKVSMDMVKDILPQLKEAVLEGHESYMRVLTDAQKAKIKSVMDDMPDYMKNLFAAIDKQGGGLSILHNWQPGMGVPDYPNPNREAARERTNTGGGRAFGGE